jgi:enoyl-CoA hydratase
MAAYSTLRIAIEDHVAVLTIDRPPLNLLGTAVLAELEAAFGALGADEEVRAIVITGAGERAFAAGADIREIAALKTQAGATDFVRAGQRAFNAIESSLKPVIAAVNGAAFGGGLELALACHLRIFSPDARVGQSECRLGIMPGWGGTQRLPRLIGIGKALEMILTGDPVDAQEALRIGLANQVASAGETLPEAISLARTLATRSPLTHAACLRAVFHGSSALPQEGLAYEAEQFVSLVGSQDAEEGLAAYLSKRSPEFTGR